MMTEDIIMKKNNKEGPVAAEEMAITTTTDEEEVVSRNNGCCSSLRFEGLDMAKGYNWLGIGRGGVVMSNVVLSTSFIYLASQEAGCFDYDNDRVMDECNNRIYGMLPIALIASIASISALISAFCMPIMGGMIDCTTNRTIVGVVASVLLGLVQTVQIGTTSSTWFVMAILQALAGFLYQVHVMSVMSFLPSIAGSVGERNMVGFTSVWVMTQFGGQASFLLLVVVVTGIIVRANSVLTAQISQGMNVAWIAVAFTLGWRLFPWKVPINRELTPGKSLWTEGFRQNWRTIKGLFRPGESKPLRYYFLALVFAEAGSNSFTTVANTYLIEALGMGGTEIALFFLVSLVFALPGSVWARFITSRTNPNFSWKLSMLFLILAGSGGPFVLDTISNIKWAAYVWAALMGLGLGWFYPNENVFFSMIVSPTQGAELSGFYVWCSQILNWLPPLIFGLMYQNGLKQKWGILVLSGFHLIAIGICFLQDPWKELVSMESSTTSTTTIQNNKTNDDVEEARKDDDDNNNDRWSNKNQNDAVEAAVDYSAGRGRVVVEDDEVNC